MSQVEMFGIPNCDTIKKARKWLEGKGVEYQFHDYKKEGANPVLLKQWCQSVGWEILLNRRGTAWRKLPDDVKESVDEISSIQLMVENPSMIKRPVLVNNGKITVGFSESVYGELFSA
ncbi:MAG TPA: ArsC family reductase [Mariprofundaceae bacterium]|nr:ArsC family reductase [Mariprofundaceae bacterium]